MGAPRARRPVCLFAPVRLSPQGWVQGMASPSRPAPAPDLRTGYQMDALLSEQAVSPGGRSQREQRKGWERPGIGRETDRDDSSGVPQSPPVT